MTTDNIHELRHGDRVTLNDDDTTTTYRFVNQYTPGEVDDDIQILTAGSAIGQRLLEAHAGDTVTVTHLDHTFTIHYIGHQAA
jgi:transcription elongation GreA/GreB family factor